ncbi:hypothetical protein C0583_05775 [Candidatus Parcubacteria bacterium]|nr:MAG: hypothetical protein C0583_05775 [Candidatus Parcubacteria bacterium]
MDEQILKLLNDSGLNEKEALVYLALLENGECKISEISDITKLKRTGLYVIIEDLIKKGLVAKAPNSKVHTFSASDPSMILNHLNVTTKYFGEMLPLLKRMGQKKNNESSMIKYYDSTEGILRVFNEMAKAKKVSYLASYSAIEKKFPGIFDKWHKEYKMLRNPQNSRYLIPCNEAERPEIKGVIETDKPVRCMDGLNGLEINFVLYDNKFGLTSLGEDMYSVVFESEAIVSAINLIYELLWKQAKVLN